MSEQHAPSTGQPGRCRECLEARHDDEPWLHAECADEREANASAEVESLQQQLAAAQGERPAALWERYKELIEERDQLRAEVDWLKREHADMHPLCSAEPGHCPHEVQVEQKDRVIAALKDMLSHSDPCIHVQMQEARASFERGEGITVEELEQRVAALDAASASQPKSDA